MCDDNILDMINLGQNNNLEVARLVDFGAYLTDGEGNDVLLPSRYIAATVQIGQKVDVFVYKDNEGRPVATTETPLARVGEFAFLKVSEVNSLGAFLDWGLMKELLVPYREQKAKMREGGVYLVYVYLDHTTQRIVASAKIEKFIGNIVPRYRVGAHVKALVFQQAEGLGYRVIVDNLHYGMIYESELCAPLELQQTLDAYVRRVRPDGKIDLTLAGAARTREAGIADQLLAVLKASPEGAVAVCDKSTPEEIYEMFKCSKKDFKKALGHLYRERMVEMTHCGIRLVRPSADGR